MESFIVLGHAPGLSLAELHAVRPEARFGAVGTSAVVLSEDAVPVFPRLGGAIKAGAVDAGTWASLEEALAALEPKHFEGLPGTGKLHFGFSAYSAGGTLPNHTGLAMKRRGIALKKELRADRPVRFVNKEEADLSSVSVSKNHLLAEGAEFVFLATENGWRRGRTDAVQDFEAFGERDFGRPARDAALGMLPPKLARILVNLAGAPERVLDPFCGVGTVLQEALLLGCHAAGSDVAPEVTAKSTDNLRWFEPRDPTAAGRWTVRTGDARNLNRVWQGERFDAVVTEPYLGPALQHRPTLEQVQDIVPKVMGILLSAIPSMASVLKPGGHLVIALPMWRIHHELLPLQLSGEFQRSGFVPVPLLPAGVAHPAKFGVTKRGSLVYERPQQRVLREVVKFQLRP